MYIDLLYIDVTRVFLYIFLYMYTRTYIMMLYLDCWFCKARDRKSRVARDRAEDIPTKKRKL